MSYSNPNVEIVIDGNGVDDRFGINFHYIEGFTSVIVAELWDYTDPNLPQKLTFDLGPDWTIDETGYPNTEVVTTVPVPLDHKIVIYREHSAIQGSSFSEGAFPAQSIEDTYDINMMVSQENKAKLERAILNYRGGPIVTIDDLAQALDDIADHETRITDNESNITTNTAQIGANALAIGANALAISTNTGQIATNTAQIAANTTAIAGVSPFTVISITSTASPYNASNKEIIIIDTIDPVEVALPAPFAGYQITVKVNDNISNKKITNASGIDGFGTDYVLSSLYESVSLVSDGAKWYII
jgi:hypothetical protein